MQASEIKNIHPELIQFLGGDERATAQMVSAPEHCHSGSLVFASQPDFLEKALKGQAAIIIVCFPLSTLPPLASHQALLHTSEMSLAMTHILPFFDTKKQRFQWGPEIHPSAYVDPSAQLGPQVKVGPGAFIGAGSSLGARTLVGANTVIENDCQIGEDCIFHPLVFIGAQTQIGHRCEIHPHTTLGADGFGYSPDKATGKNRKIPQLGKVILGDDIEIGAGCAVDRATLTATVIHSGTKFDNLVHIGHNCEIGSNSLVAAGFMMAGSSKIGSRFITGGNSVVSDHIKITDNVSLGGRSTVTNDIEKPGAYAGYPLEPLKDNLRTLASLLHLTRLRKQLKK